MPEIFVAKHSALADGDRRIVKTARGEIGVFAHAGGFYAYENKCVHSGGPACEGVIIPKVVDLLGEDKTYRGQAFDENEMHFVCPWHGYEYNLKTGVCVGDPKRKLKSYEVVRKGDDIFVIA